MTTPTGLRAQRAVHPEPGRWRNGRGTDLNCSNDPIGCWTTSFGVVDVDWTTRTFPDNVAVGLCVLRRGRYRCATRGPTDAERRARRRWPVPAGELRRDVVDDGVRVVGATSRCALGYSYSDDPFFMYCAEAMTTEGSANWWLPSCGLSGGASGGPWTQDGYGSRRMARTSATWQHHVGELLGLHHVAGHGGAEAGSRARRRRACLMQPWNRLRRSGHHRGRCGHRPGQLLACPVASAPRLRPTRPGPEGPGRFFSQRGW